MKSLAVLIFMVLVALVTAGGAEHQFTKPAALPPKMLETKTESLPSEELPARLLSPVVNTHYIDQEIVVPKTITQPVVQQQLEIQPIVRTRVQKQPVIRRIIERTVVRPHVRSEITVVPQISTQKVMQPKISEQTIVQEHFQKQHETKPMVFEKPTVQGKKTGEQLFGNQWQEKVKELVQQKLQAEGKLAASELASAEPEEPNEALKDEAEIRKKDCDTMEK